MPSSDPVRRFEDILANIRRIEEHTSGVIDLSAFAQDALVYDAVERCLERISEAAVNSVRRRRLSARVRPGR